MNRYDGIAADLVEVFDDLAQPIIWNGATYQALVADPAVSLDLQTGGFLPQADFVVKLRRDDLSTLPALGQLITIQATKYQISGITNKPTSPLIVLQVSRS
jgi:hypothetical protein